MSDAPEGLQPSLLADSVLPAAADADGNQVPGVATPASPAASAGALLRQARERQQMHVAALAGILKVPVKKIETLEADAWDDLPGTAFTRALASSVCRQLKIDPAPVLALLPHLHAAPPEDPVSLTEKEKLPAAKALSAGHGARLAIGRSMALAGLLLLLLLILALGLWLWKAGQHAAPAPAHGAPMTKPTASPALESRSAQASVRAGEGQVGSAVLAVPMASAALPAASSVASAAAAAVPNNRVLQVSSIPVSAAASAASAVSAAALPASSVLGAANAVVGANALVLQASAECWVQVTDSQEKTLLSHELKAGEHLVLQGRPPYRVMVGRAEALQIHFNGQAVAYPRVGQTGSVRLRIPALAVSAPAALTPAALAPTTPSMAASKL